MTNLIRSLLRAGGTRLVKKVGKALPVVGTAVVIGMTAYEVKKKGLLRGIVNTALDATPVIGTAKNVIEVFTGDWLPDKEPAPQILANTSRKASAALPPV
ncbi:MAG: hypothetical protein HOP19_16690 [Acidobacteria bacterium]|nr:hypothetical protein [Acidobacteriota bacterium]